ncbi:hypothetical protein DY000_02036325 [Brassica cretica]|uniref:Uncharacterized protein n=1 Tax=Brassica cretica TaxID=69181 RepID=A0ABQ7B5S5_BRACR|nr:hypothetical protein DY000_02036325 [Brassica cretica]
MFFTLVMEDQVIFVVGGIIADLAKMFRLTVAVDHKFKQLHTHTQERLKTARRSHRIFILGNFAVLFTRKIIISAKGDEKFCSSEGTAKRVRTSEIITVTVTQGKSGAVKQSEVSDGWSPVTTWFVVHTSRCFLTSVGAWFIQKCDKMNREASADIDIDRLKAQPRLCADEFSGYWILRSV